MLMDFITDKVAGLLALITSILLIVLLFTANSLSVRGSKAVISAAPKPPKPIEPISWYDERSSFWVNSNGRATSSFLHENRRAEKSKK